MARQDLWLRIFYLHHWPYTYSNTVYSRELLTNLLVLKLVYSVSDIHHFNVHKSWFRWLLKFFSKVAP